MDAITRWPDVPSLAQRRIRLLVIDDDDVDRERVRRLLARTPLTVEMSEAAAADEALHRLAADEFDCIVLDQQLGGTSGAAMLPTLRNALRRECPVIMVTGAGNEALAVQALRAGASDYLTKLQLDATTLADAIVRALDQQRARDELGALHRRLARQAEEHAAFAAAVFEHTPVALAVFDGERRCVMSNAAFAALLSRAADAVAGHGLEALLPGEGGAELQAAAGATLEDGVTRRTPVRWTDALGDAVLAEASWACVDREGRSHLLLALHDTTEQQRVHDALVAARNAAEAAMQLKSDFLANMSHEIRTPMNAIVGLSRLALDDALPEATRHYLDKVHQSSIALMGILDDVLDYSKIESGQMRFERVEFDLEQVVQRVVDLFGTRLAQQGLDFIVELAPALPRRLLGDPLRLSQVLNNLVGNAAKFTERGHVHLSVRLAPVTTTRAGRVALHFSVSDTGIGIETSQQSALFEAFRQGDASITRRFGGTGLGLAICRRLVARMDGAIGVDSQPGGGSRFWFTASLDPADGTAPAADRRIASTARAAPADEGLPPRALLLGLSVPWRQVLRAQLKAAGWRVAWLEDPGGLTSALHTPERPDVVLAGLDPPLGPAVAAALAEAARRLAGPLPGLAALATPAAGTDASGADALAALEAALATLTGAQATAWAGWQRLALPVLPTALHEALRTLQRAQGGPDAGAAEQDAALAVQHPHPSTAVLTSKPTAAPHAPAGTRSVGIGGALGGLARRAGPVQGRRVLLVEDNELNRVVAEGFLQRLGLEVTVAADGAQALSRLHAATPPPYDLVLMDVHMPGMDGLEATRRIRAVPAWRHIPVIGMTAAVMPEDRARCAEAGMVDQVAKPIVAEQLLDVLRRWVGRPPPDDPRVPALSPAAPTPPLALPGFDLGTLRELLHGDEAALRDLLVRFAQSERDRADELARLLHEGQDDALRRRLHDLRGVAGTIGAHAVMQATRALELALRDGLPPQAPLASLTSALREALQTLTTLAQAPDARQSPAEAPRAPRPPETP